ncbi:MAG: hypothetical protein V4640_01840 [Verrucomicrobiota bacterium]
MKTYPKMMTIGLLVWAAMQGSTMVKAQPAADPAVEETVAEAAPEVATAHLKLCTQLGLKVGWTYEFMIAGNDEVHYWTVRSLGARGWILVKDSRYAATWLNLSRVIAVSAVSSGSAPERPVKPNRAR